jgi:hypothetical protein
MTVAAAYADLAIRRGATDNSVKVAINTTFTGGKLTVFGDRGNRRLFTANIGDGTLSFAAGTLTWTPSAAQTHTGRTSNRTFRPARACLLPC